MFTSHGRTVSMNKHSAFVAIVKEKTKEEILKEKTYRERCIVGYRIEEMEKEYEEAKNYGRYDKKRECYVNSKGEPVVHRKEVVFDDVLAVIPLSGEYYSNVAKDKQYEKKLDKTIRDVMTASLKKRDEERMKKNVDELVDDLKKVAEVVKEKEAVTGEQQNEDDLKKKGEDDVKVESSVDVDDVDAVGEEQQKSEADQTQMEEKAEVPITEVKTESEILNKTTEQCKKCMETCSACT
ncbi:hypothetical protein Hanom_Chr03g00211031 [Helianthus anomalus]